MKMTEGCFCAAMAKRARTSFSPSPNIFEVSDDAEIEKNVAPDSAATALASSVLPVPGGPKRSRPLGGERRPVKISGRRAGRITISRRVAFASCSPAMSSQPTAGLRSMMSPNIAFAIVGSTPSIDSQAELLGRERLPPLFAAPVVVPADDVRCEFTRACTSALLWRRGGAAKAGEDRFRMAPISPPPPRPTTLPLLPPGLKGGRTGPCTPCACARSVDGDLCGLERTGWPRDGLRTSLPGDAFGSHCFGPDSILAGDIGGSSFGRGIGIGAGFAESSMLAAVSISFDSISSLPRFVEAPEGAFGWMVGMSGRPGFCGAHCVTPDGHAHSFAVTSPSGR
mmetsp:Transcript_19975/g.51516  ORF Transcript_19975/g.51516 Transcript_19975/m.51516 type:complete len:339 (+) Transcript_19975:658-1674(+)